MNIMRKLVAALSVVALLPALAVSQQRAVMENTRTSGDPVYVSTAASAPRLLVGTSSYPYTPDATVKEYVKGKLVVEDILVRGVVSSTNTDAHFNEVAVSTAGLRTDLTAETAARAAADALLIPLAQKAAVNGVATLDGGGKVPIAQLPSAVMRYLGAWNPATNTPTLADGDAFADNGDLYRASANGTANTGHGAITYFTGDFIVYNGAIWERAPMSDGVSMVNGYTGAVSLVTSDIPEGSNLYYTSARVLTVVQPQFTGIAQSTAAIAASTTSLGVAISTTGAAVADLYNVKLSTGVQVPTFLLDLSSTAKAGTCSGVNFVQGNTNTGPTCAEPSDTTGNSATTTRLLNAPTLAQSGYLSRGIDTSGNVQPAFVETNSAGVSASTNPWSAGAAFTALGLKANDASVVHTAGAENVSGVKTFTATGNNTYSLVTSSGLSVGSTLVVTGSIVGANSGNTTYSLVLSSGIRLTNGGIAFPDNTVLYSTSGLQASGNSGGVPVAVIDDLTSQVNGTQTVYTLSQVAVSTNALEIVRNGLNLRPTADYVWTAPQTVTLTSAPANGTTSLYARYFTNGSVSVTGVYGLAPVLDSFLSQVNGSQKAFNMSQSPNSSSSVFVTLDGLLLSNASDYTIVNNVITLTTAPAPACNGANASNCTSMFQAMYFVNTSTLAAVALQNSANVFSGANTISGTINTTGTAFGNRPFYSSMTFTSAGITCSSGAYALAIPSTGTVSVIGTFVNNISGGGVFVRFSTSTPNVYDNSSVWFGTDFGYDPSNSTIGTTVGTVASPVAQGELGYAVNSNFEQNVPFAITMDFNTRGQAMHVIRSSSAGLDYHNIGDRVQSQTLHYDNRGGATPANEGPIKYLEFCADQGLLTFGQATVFVNQ